MRVPWVFVGQWFRYEIFGILKDVDVDPVPTLLAIARAAKADRDVRPNLSWFSYTFYEGMITVLPASAPMRRISAFKRRV